MKTIFLFFFDENSIRSVIFYFLFAYVSLFIKVRNFAMIKKIKIVKRKQQNEKHLLQLKFAFFTKYFWGAKFKF